MRFVVPGTVALSLLMALPLGAESLGSYSHGTLRSEDEHLMVCYDEVSAIETAEAVNGALLDLLDQLSAAPDAAALTLIYQQQLYPSPGWGVLLQAIRDLRCDLVDHASHISRSTVFTGPVELQPLEASHSVVQSDFLIGVSQATTPGWVLTTEAVPD
ncbi:MAG: hypothetical protein HOL02_02905 [Rhodospirillaceae bacterium]|nr:hypothetical protein [Rhodospirillaceae bacterium]MBT7647965.1 hypothetical protein [Rhodospirillaceae bacterium]